MAAAEVRGKKRGRAITIGMVRKNISVSSFQVVLAALENQELTSLPAFKCLQ